MPALAPKQEPTAFAFARIGLLIYTLLIVYASWYPFSGWHSNGLSALAFLWAPLPYYWTMFDLTTNIAAYLPFGILVVFAVYPEVRRIPAMMVAIIAGTLLSGTMETVQTFLPSRVPSNLDFITNVAGTCIGALIGVLLTRTLLEKSRLLLIRERWFSQEASRGLIVLGLWPLAQIYPQSYLFGQGQIAPILSNKLSDWFSMPVDLSALMRYNIEPTIEQYWLAETIITACGLVGALLTLLCLLRNDAPRMMLVMALLAAAVTVKSLASALWFTPENAFVWLTPGAQGGVLIAVLMFFGLAFAPPIAQRRVAVLALLISLFAVNAAPSNPYFIATMQTWVQGKFLNFNGATHFLSVAWPFFALWFLLHPVHRLKPK